MDGGDLWGWGVGGGSGRRWLFSLSGQPWCNKYLNPSYSFLQRDGEKISIFANPGLNK